MTHKRCSACEVDLPHSHFRRNPKSRDGLNWCCRVCEAEKRKLQPSGAPTHRAKVRQKERLARYGLTPHTMSALWTFQEGCCAVCGRRLTQGTGGHAVDHDHVTGAARGLLCVRCNLIEGLVHKSGLDPVEYSTRLATYLAQPPWDVLSITIN